MENEKIKDLLASGAVGAITIDTNVFDAEGKNVQDGNLLLLRQVAQAGKQLLFSDMTAREMERHLREKLESTKAFDAKVLVRLKKLVPDDVIQSVTDAMDGQEQNPKAALNNYFGNVSATVIQAADYTSIDELMNRYFAAEPPFEADAKKKAEFPDAIALLTLEGWAKKHDTKVLCVSSDGDWKRYAEKSDRLIIAPELKDVLAALVRVRGEMLPDRVRVAAASWLASGPAKEQLEGAVQFELDDHLPYVDADSYCGFDEEVVELFVRQDSFSLDVESAAVLSADAEEAVISVSASFVADGKFAFSFFVRDSIDKDNVPVGHSYAESATDVRVELSITLDIEDFATGKASELSSNDVTEIAVKMERIDFNVGTVGPDYSRDEDD